MITTRDVQALIQLLRRTPVSDAEALFLESLMGKLFAIVSDPEPDTDEQKKEEEEEVVWEEIEEPPDDEEAPLRPDPLVGPL